MQSHCKPHKSMSERAEDIAQEEDKSALRAPWSPSRSVTHVLSPKLRMSALPVGNLYNTFSNLTKIRHNTAAERLASYNDGEDDLESDLARPCGMAKSIVAVSYTHLDVYKRQNLYDFLGVMMVL